MIPACMSSIFLFIELIFLVTTLIINCARKPQPQKPNARIVDDKTVDPLYDETQQTVELQEDPLANVRLLTPSLPGGCNDENAAKEAANRHKTNAYFPELEIQKERIVDSTKSDEIRRMIERLPPHPPQRYRKGLKDPSIEERYARWKDVHVSWHEKGLVFLVRRTDSCRAKDDGPGDTIDSPFADDDEDEKINSEMPISENCENRPPNAASRGREKSTQKSTAKSLPTVAKSTKTKSSKKSKRSKRSKRATVDEKKLDKTQQETALPTVTPQTAEEIKSEHCQN